MAMRRREFIAGIGSAAAWPLVARAQTVPIVGYLSPLTAAGSERTLETFRLGLAEAGFTDGRNISVEVRYAEGQIGTLSTLAQDLVRRRVAVIAAMSGSRSTLAAKAATATIPIVFTMGDADPVELGVVASLARPGGNVTGISLLGGALGAKRLELLREIVPAAATIGVLINPRTETLLPTAKSLRLQSPQVDRKPSWCLRDLPMILKPLSEQWHSVVWTDWW
jgi:putative tryptophan/tyrosine transport system substrate-binding protein